MSGGGGIENLSSSPKKFTHKDRVTMFENTIKQEHLDIKFLRSLCSEGIPDGKGFRPICWRILLDVLPRKSYEWPETLAKNRFLYYKYVEEFVVGEPTQTGEDDHPLSTELNSQWKSYFKDNETLSQIDKDVRRTLPNMAFFHQEVDVFNDFNINQRNLGNTLLKRLGTASLGPTKEGAEYHWQVIERLLYVYAKLNPGVGYVQGMNDIIGPLYFVMATDSNVEWKKFAEADTFFCFVSLMVDIRDNFVKSLDNAITGIKAQMNQLISLVQKFDYELWQNLNEKQIHPQFFSFRWLTLLLCQDFELPEVIRLWDSLFSSVDRSDFIVFFCCSMLLLIRDEVIRSDFSETVRILQNYPFTEVAPILVKTYELLGNR